MRGTGPKSEGLIALFVLGLVMFNPPLLSVFDAGPDATVSGIPILFLYLFAAWALLIALVVVAVGRLPLTREKRRPEDR